MFVNDDYNALYMYDDYSAPEPSVISCPMCGEKRNIVTKTHKTGDIFGYHASIKSSKKNAF